MARFRLDRGQSIPAPGPAPSAAGASIASTRFATGTPGAAARRRPLARTLSRARWAEYERLLTEARRRGYELWSLEDWLRAHGSPGARAIILRHDVDQYPGSVAPMLAIERRLGVRSTWYFRWRTAARPVIDAVRAAGGDVGFHYETLTRLALERSLTATQIDDQLIAQARSLLAREIAAFRQSYGPIASVCPHGDSRAPGVSNQVLLEGQAYADYGIEFDGNDAINRYPLSLWLTDRSVAEGRWKEGRDPLSSLAAGLSPLLLVIHPNNWCSGASLWRDRALSACLPAPRAGDATGGRRSIIRTGSDSPPALPAPRVRRAADARIVEFGAVSTSLRREVLRFHYDAGKAMVDSAGLNTLATNAELAESRAAMLEQALAEAGVPTLAGLDVLDVGCGFGALALVFAAHGARVTALDPNEERMEVGRAVAERHGLPVRFVHASMEQMQLGEGTFDVAVMNNSLCYLVRRRDRSDALHLTLAALRPGGALVVRNPNRLHPRDQFTGVPLLGVLPPRAARGATRMFGRHRSTVRLLTNGAARRELRAAGFDHVRSARRARESRARAAVTGYQHLTGRRPEIG